MTEHVSALIESSNGEPSARPNVLDGLIGPGARLEVGSDDNGDRNFVNRPRSVIELVARASRSEQRDQDFLVQGEQRITFGDFASVVFGASRGLAEAGLVAGDRVAILAPNCIEWVVGAFATAAAGGVAVAFNTTWTPAEVAYALDNSGPRFLIVHEELHELVMAALELVTASSGLNNLYVIGAQSTPIDGQLPFASLMMRADEPLGVEVAETDPFVVIYTSGTTGRAKGCITTHRGTIAQVNSMVLSSVVARATSSPSKADVDIGRSTRHALLVTSPLFHVSGFHSGVCSALATRTKVVFLTRKFDAVDVLELIDREQITAWGGVPTMIHRVVTCERFADFSLASLRSVSIGGAPLRPATLELAQQRLGSRLSIGHGYGMTETTGSVTMNAGRGLSERPGSVGVCNPLLDLQVWDEDGRPVPPGTSGEIVIRGVTVTPGFWGDDTATAAAIRDGWLHTGDVGTLDDEGYLFVRDRLKDLIIRGGENIAAVEIEHCIADHPAVEEVAVFGIPDDDLGERIGAAVVLRQPTETSVEELVDFVASRLGRVKAPESMWILDGALPRNALGKVVKARVRELVNTTD